MSDARTRVVIIGHRLGLTNYIRGVYESFGRQFDLKIVLVDDGWPKSIDDIPDARSYDACVWFVRFRELVRQAAFDWKDYAGCRVMYEWDAHANYHTMLNPVWIGRWPAEFRRHRFDVLVTTGKRCQELLEADGVPSYWLPKGFDRDLFFDREEERRGVCYFGDKYCSRRAMLHYLRSRAVEVEDVTSKYDELNGRLNRHLACLVCNMGGTVRGGLFRVANRIWPSRGVMLEPGIEPMQKNFEVAAAGCAPVFDWIEELSDLGFREGETMIAYRSFPELLEKLRHYESRPDELRRIGTNAGKLAAERHSWDHRAGQLDRFLHALKAGQSVARAVEVTR